MRRRYGRSYKAPKGIKSMIVRVVLQVTFTNCDAESIEASRKEIQDDLDKLNVEPEVDGRHVSAEIILVEEVVD